MTGTERSSADSTDPPGVRRDELRRFLDASLRRPVPYRRTDTPAQRRRRRLVSLVTLAVGAVLLGIGLNVEPGDNRFYLYTGLLAVVWIGGAVASGPLRLGRAWTRSGGMTRPLVQPLALGLLAVGIFCAGALLVAQVPALTADVAAVLDHARYASLPLVVAITVVNGIAEELFFRGALFSAVGDRWPVLVTSLLYALVTAATGNPMLVFAAIVLGLLVGLQRRVTGGVLAPTITHLTWSLGMLFLLPPLFDLLT